MAGRQRMLSQRMSKEYFLIAKGFEAEQNKANLVASINLFHSSLYKLINGSLADAVPAAPSLNSLRELQLVEGLWLPFKALLEDTMNSSPIPPEGLEFVRTKNIPLLKQANKAVGRLVDDSQVMGFSTTGLQVDIAGRQRMLSQKMSKEVAMISIGLDVPGAVNALKGTIDLFTNSHLGLLRGTPFLDLVETRNRCVLKQMRVVSDQWRHFEPLVRRVSHDEVAGDDMLRKVAQMNPVLLNEMNKAVGLYVAQSQDCPQELSRGDWLRVLGSVAMDQSMIWQCARLFLQFAVGVDAAESRNLLMIRLAAAEESLRHIIEGSVWKQIVAPVSQSIADVFTSTWSNWVSFDANLERSLYNPPILMSDLQRVLGFGNTTFWQHHAGLMLYLDAACSSDPSVPVGSIELAGRMSVLVEEMTLEAAKSLFMGDPASIDRMKAAVAGFSVARYDILHGRPASPNARLVNRTSDACKLRLMQTMSALYDPMEAAVERFLHNASSAAISEMGRHASTLHDILDQVVDFYTHGASTCSLQVSDREWEALMACSGHANALFQRVWTEVTMINRGVSAPWGNAQGHLAATLKELNESMETLTYGNNTLGLPSPPVQAIVDHLIQLADLWAAFAENNGLTGARRLAAAGEPPLDLAESLASLYAQSARDEGSAIPVARLLTAGRQPVLIERIVREAMALGQGVPPQTMLDLLREFEAAHKLLVQGSPAEYINSSSYVPPTTERPIIPQMQRVFASFQRFKPRVEAIATAGQAGRDALAGLVAAAVALGKEADAAADLYGQASTLAVLTPARILAPVPLTGSWSPGGVMQQAALLAQEIINEQQMLLPGMAVDTVFVDDRCDQSQGIRSVLNKITTSYDWVGLGGMACPSVCTSTAIVAESVYMPVVSYGCAVGHAVVDPASDSQGMVRMGTAMSGTAQLVLDLAAMFGWTRLSVLADSSRVNLKDTEALVDALKGGGLATDWKSLSADNSVQLEVTVRDLLLGRHREVLLMGHEYFCRRVACAAKTAGITKGMTWLSTGLKSRGWHQVHDAAVLAQDATCTGDVLSEYLQGSLIIAGAGMPREDLKDMPLDCLRGHTPRSFEALLEERLARGHAGSSSLYDGVAGLVADGTCVFAFTVQHMLQMGYTIAQLQRPSPPVYQEMLAYIKDRLSFFGVSGHVTFVGADKPGNLALWQLQQNSTVMVGYRDANGTASLATNGGPSSDAWAPHPPDPPSPEFPWIVVPFTLISGLVCSSVCLGIWQGLKIAKTRNGKAAQSDAARAV